MSSFDRRSFLRGGLAAAALGGVGAAVTACTSSPAAPAGPSGGLIGPDSTQITAAEAARHGTGCVVSAVLDAMPGPVDLGGVTVRTWSYQGEIPGPEIGSAKATQSRRCWRTGSRTPRPCPGTESPCATTWTAFP